MLFIDYVQTVSEDNKLKGFFSSNCENMYILRFKLLDVMCMFFIFCFS